MAASSSSPTSSSQKLSASKEKTNGTKLTRLLIDGGTDTLRKFLDTIHPPEGLKDALNNHKPRLEALKRRGVIFESQWEKLFPPSDEAPDSRTFDITLLHLLFREICSLKAPSTGWHDLPAEDDESPEANIATVKHFRNKLCHSRSTGISDTEFEDYWNKISQALSSLEITTFQKKNDPIDPATQQRLDKDLETWSEMERGDEHEMSSCIPDQGMRVFGRENEVNQVKEALLCGKGVVLITGGPGFGKTTVAKKVAREFTETSSEKRVLFCSIASKFTSSDVAIEMILATGKGGNQPPEMPEYWLRHWSGRLQQKVVFVLDNADDVLNGQERGRFLNLLIEMRKQSRQNIKFVVTSRVEFSHSDLDIFHITIDCLLKDKAKQVLLSRVDNPKHVSDPDTLVELCGCVPLALCIAGSLLSDYTEQRLIEQLKQDPSGTLIDEQRPENQQSVERTIMASLKSLSNSKEKASVLITVFRGSFTSTAAQAVFKACPDLEIPAEETLHFLKSRSLIEQVSSGDDVNSRRYQMHLLVQDCLEKMGQKRYAELLSDGKRLASSYFMTCISENTAQYWGKDTCGQAIKSFNEDRHNFEYFLQNYVHYENLQDREITKVFLNNLAQKCMYLEKCVVPKAYKSFLESFMMLAKAQRPVHQVELLCLLADVTNTLEGKKEGYEECILSAKQLLSEYGTDFATNPLSEVLFRNFYAAFLTRKGMKMKVEAEEQTNIALKLCKEKLSKDHPETAATLLFAGERAKRSSNTKAKELFNKSLEMFKQRLGNHPMTAQALKKLADVHFFCNELDTAQKRYKEALKVFKTIGEADHLDCVLILKNLGALYRKKKNFKEATEVLQRAEEICYQDSNKWKIMVKTEKALLHDDKGERDQAKMVMQETLNCWCKDLKLTVDDLPKRKEIREFLDRYPELKSTYIQD